MLHIYYIRNNPSTPLPRLSQKVPEITDELEQELKACIEGTTRILAPLLHSEEVKQGVDTLAGIPKSSFLLLLHPELWYLPIEGVPPLRDLKSVSRDFSLHLFHHRLVSNKEIAAGTSPNQTIYISIFLGGNWMTLPIQHTLLLLLFFLFLFLINAQ